VLQGPGTAADAPAPTVKWVYVSTYGTFQGEVWSIEVSDDGSSWTEVIDDATLRTGTYGVEGLVAIPEADWRHRYWRVSFSDFSNAYWGGISGEYVTLLSDDANDAICRLATNYVGSGGFWGRTFVGITGEPQYSQTWSMSVPALGGTFSDYQSVTSWGVSSWTNPGTILCAVTWDLLA
jgi:hypothetical protein